MLRTARNVLHQSQLIPVLVAAIAVIGIVAILSVLGLRDGLVSVLAGVALMGLTSLVTLYLGREYFASSPVAASVNPSLEIMSGTLKLLEDKLRQMEADRSQAQAVPSSGSEMARKAIAILDRVPGVTAASAQDFKQAIAVARLKDGTILKSWKNLVGADYVFLGSPDNQMIYGCYVGWLHSKGLRQAIVEIKQELT